jgi:signal peptidase I
MMNNNRQKDRFSLMRELQEELFRRDGEGWFKVVSGSMYPLIGVNDRVLVKRLDIRELRAGDIILFKVDDKCIAHRIIRVLKRDGTPLFYQKGDANAYASLLSPESIMGKVTAVEKKGHILVLTSGRIRIINYLLAMENCIFSRFPITHNGYEGIMETDKHIYSLRCQCSWVKKPLHLCNRIIAKMIS